MNLHKLTLHNVGPFLGKHTFALESTEKHKPITLIGALNGSGKTTFLESLLLVLYGKRSPSLRKNKAGSYSTYLERLINQQVAKTDGASIGLEFKMNHDGEERHFAINRSWSSGKEGSQVTDLFEVIVDDQPDPLLTQEWGNFMELILPVKLSELFFFDGEQIESLADPEKSNEFLSSAIDELLGIGLINQLGVDLDTLIERRNKSSIELHLKEYSSETIKQKDSLEQKKEVCKSDANNIRNRISEFKENRKFNENKLDKLTKKLEKSSSELWKERSSLETELAVKNQELSEVEIKIRDIVSSEFPFRLVGDLLEEAILQVQEDANSLKLSEFSDSINEYENKLLADLAKCKPKDIGPIQILISEYRKEREKDSKKGVLFGLSLTHDDHVMNSIKDKSEDCFTQFLELQEKYRCINYRIDSIDQILKHIPEGDEIENLLLEEAEIKSKIHRFYLDIEAERKDLLEKEHQLSKLNEEYAGFLAKEAASIQDDDEQDRVLIHVERVKKTLDLFKSEVYDYHLEKLESNILKSLKLLMRKNQLVSSIHIPKDRHIIEVRNAEGHWIPPDRLSAGERQLLAVATLWGLAQSTGRKLPVVIDTPLSRLDSKHRREIVKEYFPAAADQVIILSTDEEINEKYYPLLKDSISNEYLIEFDDEKSSSNVIDGYWFGTMEPALVH